MEHRPWVIVFAGDSVVGDYNFNTPEELVEAFPTALLIDSEINMWEVHLGQV